MDLRGEHRREARNRSVPLARVPLARENILNRLEDSGGTKSRESHRHHRILSNPERIDTLLLDLFVESFETPPTELVLDIDATDNPLHGNPL